MEKENKNIKKGGESIKALRSTSYIAPIGVTQRKQRVKEKHTTDAQRTTSHAVQKS